MISTEIELEVPFYDVDSFRVVWHGNYPKYFEKARCALLNVIEYPYTEMEKSGYFFPVIDLSTRYVRPIFFEQKILIKATLVQWQHKLKIDYKITDSDSRQLLTKGSTNQVAISIADNITQYQSPPELLSKVAAALKK